MIADFRIRILGANRKRDSTARGKLRCNDRLTRRAGFNEVVQNTICYCFVERVFVAIRREIEFKRLAFDAPAIRNIIDIDSGKIWLAGDRANRSEIVCFKMNPVIAVGRRIWKRLQPRLGWRSGQLRFALPEQC